MRSTCRCPSCLSAPTALARPSTTAALARRIRFGDIFTVFYSSTLATAAVADAEWKDAKRKDLDASIAKAIDDLKATEREQERRIQGLLRSAKDELWEVKAQKQLSAPTLQGILRPLPSWQSSDAPHPEIKQAWGTGGRVRIVSETSSRGLDTKLKDGAPIRLRRLQAKTKENPRKRENETKTQHESSCGVTVNNIGPTVKRSDDQPLSEASKTRSATATLTLWTTSGAIRRQRGVKIVLKSRNYSNQASVRESRADVANSLSVAPVSNVSKVTSQDAHQGLPELRYLPHGTGTGDSLDQRLDALWLNRGMRLHAHHFASLPRGQRNSVAWSRPGHQRPLDEPEMARLEMSVAKLIHHFLIMAIDASKCRSIVLTLPGWNKWSRTRWPLTRDHIKLLRRVILQLKDELTAAKPGRDAVPKSAIFPRYSNNVRDSSGQTDLNQLVIRAFAKSTDLGTLLPRICFYLLRSPAPPDVHTYNNLIIQLCYLQYYDVAAAVVKSMSESGILPNEITTAAILRLYSYMGDVARFEKYARFLNTESVTAIMSLDNGRRTAGSATNSFVYEDIAPCNAASHKALILGWLSFGKFENALIEYQSMVCGGWFVHRQNLNRRVIVAIIQYCVKTHKWGLGAAAFWGMLRKYRDTGPDNLILEQYYWMLQLCVSCQRSSAFKTVLETAIVNGIELPATLQMTDFVSTENELQCLMRDVELLERLKGRRALPSNEKPVSTLPKLSDILNLRDWVSECLYTTDPRRWRFAGRARPAKHVSTYRHTSQTLLSRQIVCETNSEWSKNWNAHAQPRTIDVEALENAGPALDTGNRYGDVSPSGQFDEIFSIDDEPPRELPAWL